MTPPTLLRGARRGYSLTELLIVVIVLLTVMAIALPLAKKVLDDSHVREASRQLSAYLAMAKARAVQTGRPCGLEFVCESPLADTSGVKQVTKMFLAEVPPHYAGGVMGARGKCAANPGSTPPQYYFLPVVGGTAPPVIDFTEMQLLAALLEDGEQFLVRFDHKGDWYRFQYNENATSPYYFVYQGSVLGGIYTGTNIPQPVPPGWNETVALTMPPTAGTTLGKSYQVLRQPRRIGNPLELPRGTCIDLAYSGVGVNNWDFTPAATSPHNSNFHGMIVLFRPNGGVDSYYLDVDPPPAGLVNPVLPQGTLQFLIGKVEKVAPPRNPNANFLWDMFDPAQSNLADPTSLWVSVGHSTGAVATSENSPPTFIAASGSTVNFQTTDTVGAQQTVIVDINTNPALYLQWCRSIASSRQQVAGR